MAASEWLLPAFEAGVQSFADQCPAAQGWDMYEKNKGQEIASIEGWIYFNSFVLLFEYTAHALMSEVNSVLECKLLAEKNNLNGPRYSLMDVFNALDIKDFRCVMIPSIANAAAMAAAFAWLGGILEEHLPAIAALMYDEEQRRRLENCFNADVQRFFADYKPGEDESGGNAFLGIYYGWLRGRFGFSQGAYLRYLAGDVPRACRKLAKTKKTLVYEQRLLAYLEAPGQKPDPLPPILRGQATGTRGTDIRYPLGVFASWLPLTALCLPFYIGLFYLLRVVALRGQLLLIGPDPFYAFFPAFFTSIALSFFTRKTAIRLLFRRRAAELLETDAILIGRGTMRFMKGFIYVVFLGGLIFLTLYVNTNIAFGEAGFTDNRGAFNLHGEYHSYAEIEHVFHRPDRVNGYGDTIPFDSYVLALCGGDEIDLYEHCETDHAREKVLPLLRERGVEVREK